MGTRNRLSAVEWFLLGISFIAIVLMGWQVVAQGITYDSAFDMEAYNTISKAEFPSSLEQAYEVAPITSEFYGLLTFQVTEFVGSPFGVTIDPNRLESYQLHHGFIALLSVLGAVAIGSGTGVALRSRVSGLFAATLILVTPLWMGLGTMDYKDVPIAAGLSLLSLALTISFTRTGWGWMATAIGTGVAGTVVAFGTRAGSIALVVALVGIALIVQVARAFVDRESSSLIRVIVVIAASLSGGFAWLYLSNPFARLGIVRWLRDAVDISQSYIWIGLVRTAGQDLLSNELPWWYVPAWLGAQLPLVTSVLCLVGILLLLVGLRYPRSGDVMPNRGTWIDLTPILSQGVVLPIVVIGSGAVLYDGIRHLLFALPAFVALSAVLVAKASTASRKSSRKVSTWTVAMSIAMVGVVLSLSAVARWFPYTYSFINPIAGWDKSERDWELDYWGVTSREGVARLRVQGLDPIVVVPAPETGRPFNVIGPQEGSEYSAATGQARGVYVFRRWDRVFRQDWCARTVIVERDGLILGEGGICP